MAEYTNIERETVILYNQAEKTATISTMDPSLIRKIEKMRSDDPAIAVLEARPGYMEYQLPKKYIKVRGTQQLSDEKKQLMAERLKARLEAKKNDENRDTGEG